MANIFTVNRNSHHTSETRALSSMNCSESIIITERNVLSAKQGSRKLVCFTVFLTVGEGNNPRIFQPTPY